MDLDLSRCQPGTCPAECEGLTCSRDTRHVLSLCHGFRTNPAAWGPKIIEGARKDATRSVPSELQALLDSQRRSHFSATHSQFIPQSGEQRGVVQVWPMANIGGAERVMISILKATSPAILWHGVAILSTTGNSPEMLSELQSLCPVAIGADETRAMVASSKVVVTWATPDIPSLIPVGGKRPKVVAVSHSPSGSPWAMEVVGQTKGVDHWVAVSRAATAPVPKSDRNRVTIIPNAIDPDRLRQRESRDSVHASWRIPLGAKILGCYHRQSSEKDPTALARAIANLPDNWFGVSVGSGFEDSQVRQHAATVARDRVIVLPSRVDAGSVLGAFDAMLVSSQYESFCLSMAEAFAFGLPVISTPVGIALEWPALVRPIPIDDDGQQIAAAVLADESDPVGTAKRAAVAKRMTQHLWYPDRFAIAWKKMLLGMIGEHEPPSILAAACANRGCRTGCGHAVCNREHREVTLDECVVCATASTPVLIGA